MRRFVLMMALVLAVGGAPGAARATVFDTLRDGSAPERVHLERQGEFTGTLATPQVVGRRLERQDGRGPQRLDPFWTREALWASVPESHTRTAPETGPAVYDPSSDAWFATSAGALVRVAPGEGLPVIVDGVEGHDVDVRARARVAVSREPGDRIVLHRFGREGVSHRVLLQGAQYFNPRLSPSGDAALVSESRASGGHVWLVRLVDGTATDLGEGYGATWHPDGTRVLIARVTNDSFHITSGELWSLDLARGTATPLTATADRAETEPAVSLDGRWVAFVDGRTGTLQVAALPDAR